MPSPGVLWRQRRWRLLLNLIDHLPPNAHSNVALANDEEYAKMVLKERLATGLDLSENKKSAPDARTWTTEVSMLAAIIDKLSVLAEMQSQNPKQIVPYPRPRTAFDNIEDTVMMAKKQAVHDYLTRQLIPSKQ